MASAGGDISGASSFLGTLIQGIGSAEKSAAANLEAIKRQVKLLTGFFGSNQLTQSSIEENLVGSYEAQLIKEQKIAQYKAIALDVLMIILVIALLWAVSKVKK